MPYAAEPEVVVERAPEYRGWRIRTSDQLPGTGSVVTDNWLAAYGFIAPTKFNLGKIIAAMHSSAAGVKNSVPDLDHVSQKWGDPLSEKGAAVDIEYGERLGKYF
jgi:hypothetical protein